MAGALLAAAITVAEAAAAASPLEPGVARELARWCTRHYADVRYALDLAVAAPVDLVLAGRPPEGGRSALFLYTL